jgi:hypothetical protein
MSVQQHQSLKYLTFDSLQNQALKHAVFMRKGGVSAEPFSSLNLSRSVGDIDQNVAQNEVLVFDSFKRDISSIADSYLEHGTHAIYAESAYSSRNDQIQYADILLTDNPEVTLFMRFGDCFPILLYDPKKQAIALAHAGWRGTLLGVAAEAVASMEEQFQSNPKDLIAAIGPGICVDHYEVGQEVIRAVQDKFDGNSERFLPEYEKGIHFDIAATNRYLLRKAGVEQIDDCGICTSEHVQDWFSHRAERGKTGRFGVLMALDSK